MLENGNCTDDAGGENVVFEKLNEFQSIERLKEERQRLKGLSKKG